MKTTVSRASTFACAIFLLTTLIGLAGSAGPASATPRRAQPAAKPAAGPESAGPMTAETFSGLALRGIGPGLMSGRIADVAIDPTDRATWYVAAGSGGVWKTTDNGTTWTPVFDHEGSYSIGCVTVDPNDPSTVWVGTGENVSGRHVGYGDGVYRSRDGGTTWENLGLPHSEHIAKILVDPRSSDTVWVASEGPLWSSGGERGVYKTTDGGKTWRQVLGVSADTGATDLEADPADPDTLYAATYERRRKTWALLAGGPESGIYKSTDGGEHWRKLATGLPKGDLGKIGLAVSPQHPEVVYATIEAGEKDRGFYRSADGGESWEKRSSYTSGGTGPHYYQEIYASPYRFDRVYQMDVWIHVTDDGGKTFTELGEPGKHSDNHALAFDPAHPGHLLAGCDGGLYESWNDGASWRHITNLPVTQIYKMALDDDRPFYHVVGGTQDNGTIYGPTATASSNGIRNRDWIVPFGADGYACAIDPQDPDTLYVTWQNGHLLRYDRRTRETLDVQPLPAPGDPPERWNWDSPVLVSPHSHTRIYFGSQRLWRSDDRGDSWTAISPDLSRGQNRYELPMRQTAPGTTALYDNGAMSWYGNLTSISESPLVEGLLYVGTDDGLIQVSEDGGESWRKVEKVPGVPEGSFVNQVRASVHDPDTVFAALDNHKQGDYHPYLVKSTDRGRTWTSMAGDLPERDLVWALAQDSEKPDLLFAATELGLDFTMDGGAHWIALTGGVPHVAFRDLEIQRREGDLVAASFGRGFFVLDDYTPLRQANVKVLGEEAHLFPVRTAKLYVPSVDLGVPGQAYEGEQVFMAPNPPFGALLTYYLRDGWKSPREERSAEEAKLREEGKDAPFPGWPALRRESRSGEPKLVLTIRDSEGRVVRRLTGPTSEGFHRVAWDLRYPSSRPVTKLEDEPPPIWGPPPGGPLVTPGTYTARLARLVDGELQPLGEAQSFQVQPLEGRTGLGNADPQAILAFEQKTADLQRRVFGAGQVLDDTDHRLQLVEKALLATPGAPPELLARTRALELRRADLALRLEGDPVRGGLDEPQVPSIAQRVQQIIEGHWHTTSAPTQTQRRSLEVAETEFQQVDGELRTLVDTDLAKLEADLTAAGAPWTPGQGVPK